MGRRSQVLRRQDAVVIGPVVSGRRSRVGRNGIGSASSQRLIPILAPTVLSHIVNQVFDGKSRRARPAPACPQTRSRAGPWPRFIDHRRTCSVWPSARGAAATKRPSGGSIITDIPVACLGGYRRQLANQGPGSGNPALRQVWLLAGGSRPGLTQSRQDDRRRRSITLAPCIFFITWPMSPPTARTLPSRIFSATLGIGGNDRVDGGLESPLS